MTTERKETVADVLAEMAHDGSPWGKLRDEYIARIEDSHAREIAELKAEIEMRDDIIEGWKNGAKQKDAEIERWIRINEGYRSMELVLKEKCAEKDREIAFLNRSVMSWAESDVQNKAEIERLKARETTAWKSVIGDSA